jgi:hypothetical protein
MPALDVFDTLLDKTCTVMQIDPAGGKDDRGVASQALVPVFSNIACRISTLGFGKESKIEKGAAVSRYQIFMRVIAITEHHRIILEGVTYNVLDVKNPAGMNHHLEILVEKVSA